MSAHTPGPWVVCEDAQRHGTQRLHLTVRTEAKHGRYSIPMQIASVVREEDLDNTRANARLIAAAPDLLAAAKSFLLCEDPSDCSECIGRFKAAIAKAEERT